MSLQRGLVSFPTVPTNAIGSKSFSLSPSLLSPLPCVISAYSLRHHLWVLLCANLLREPTCLIKGFCLSLRTTLQFCSDTHTQTHSHACDKPGKRHRKDEISGAFVCCMIKVFILFPSSPSLKKDDCASLVSARLNLALHQPGLAN